MYHSVWIPLESKPVKKYCSMRINIAQIVVSGIDDSKRFMCKWPVRQKAYGMFYTSRGNSTWHCNEFRAKAACTNPPIPYATYTACYF